MKNTQQHSDVIERRVMSRIDAALRINYQIIHQDVVLHDPYDPIFLLPRYFLLLAELDQFDHALKYELEQLSEKDQQIARILSIFNQKMNLITGSYYDSIVQTMLPSLQQVNFSASGLSFFSSSELAKGSYIHITLSHPEHFHVAATAQVVYSQEENNNYRTGVHFITLLPQDQAKLAAAISELST